MLFAVYSGMHTVTPKVIGTTSWPFLQLLSFQTYQS